jgi:predicted DCC family thiol-disulfide oxidoreductase YuxK
MNYELIHPMILFDGVCNLCCGSVQFIIKHDKKKQFRFALLQSNSAKEILQNIPQQEKNIHSIILLQNGKFYFQSTAVLMIAKQLNGLIPLLYWLIIIPKFIRDGVYGFIAKHRYKWFGKTNECWLPTKELSELFYE